MRALLARMPGVPAGSRLRGTKPDKCSSRNSLPTTLPAWPPAQAINGLRLNQSWTAYLEWGPEAVRLRDGRLR